MTAEIAYDKQPAYERWHPSQLGYGAVDHVLKEAREALQGNEHAASIEGSVASAPSTPASEPAAT